MKTEHASSDYCSGSRSPRPWVSSRCMWLAPAVVGHWLQAGRSEPRWLSGTRSWPPATTMCRLGRTQTCWPEWTPASSSKRENVADTLRRLHDAGLLHADAVLTDENTADRALAALDGGELLNVIEYQRAVHAEAKTLDDAAVRGVSPVGGDLYVTTYPCHLCYKHCLSTQLASVRYIDPYPKSRATAMYPTGSGERLQPYEGVAPRRYIQTFETRPPPVSDWSGIFTAPERRAALPLDRRLRNDDDRADEERLAISELREEYQ